jgi:hypothetical protein
MVSAVIMLNAGIMAITVMEVFEVIAVMEVFEVIAVMEVFEVIAVMEVFEVIAVKLSKRMTKCYLR